LCNSTIGTQRWRAINQTVGITRLLPEQNEFPSPVTHGFVGALQARPSMAAVEELVTTWFATDSLVRVIAGALQGRFAKVLSSHRTATRVRVEAFGREVTATIATADLQQAAE
jgi:transcription antitermination factor NusG